jgi:hypothetical protein
MSATSRLQNLSSVFALISACIVFGGTIGWMSVDLLSTEAAPVRNGFGSASAALLIGGLSGGVAGVYLARDISPTARWWSTAVALLLAAGTLWSLDLTAR